MTLQTESVAGFDICDLRLMLHDHGVRGRHLSDALITLHTSLRDACFNAGLGDMLSTRHLLHCAELCQQQLDIGIDSESALTEAASDVYVRSMRDRSVSKVRSSNLQLC